MAGGVHQVQHIMFAILGGVFQAHGLGFDGDAALTLDVHGIQDLFLHVPGFKAFACLDQPISQGRFSVVNMSDDGKITDVRRFNSAH